jgi:hypothetical protein
MKKMLVQLGIVVSAIASIVPAVSAQSIANGNYSNNYPDSQGVKIRNNSFSVWYSTSSPEPWKSIPKGVFKYIKPGVFYSNTNNEYHCLITGDIERYYNQSSRYVSFDCSKNGWIKKYGSKKRKSDFIK